MKNQIETLNNWHKTLMSILYKITVQEREALADTAGVSDRTVNKWKLGQAPQMALFLAFINTAVDYIEGK